MEKKTLIDVGSDLHLAFGGWDKLAIDKISNSGSTVCILAGDIVEVADMKAKNGFTKSVYKFLRELNDRYEKVIWVMGNHEFYRNHFYFTEQNLRSRLQENGLTNFIVLEKQFYIHGDIEFFGATMWTSLRDNNPIAVNCAESFMNDYQEIRVESKSTAGPYSGKLRAEHTMAEFRKTRKELEYFANKESKLKKVVVTHMAPSCMSVHENYKSSAVNDAYYEEFGNMIYASNIAAWFHGHLHDSVSYTIGETLVMSNCRGYYAHETAAYDWKFKQVEI
jgi:UDP-2,3-diacylglucosamine pyrophosphatase LpxH